MITTYIARQKCPLPTSNQSSKTRCDPRFILIIVVVIIITIINVINYSCAM